MNRRVAGTALLFTLILAATLFQLLASNVPITRALEPSLALTGPVANEDELAAAADEWSRSAHADTYDAGLGADTTCARCKSPLNWDPGQDLAAQQALDCGSCKRVPGAPRPTLAAGVPVGEADWQDISCPICHVPVGDSYEKSVSFWNQATGLYEPVANTMELCAHCHEGQHGFEVVEEQESSSAHHGWECTVCHGAHGDPASCTDCHDPTTGPGAAEHARHPSTHCTGCHDNGRLSVWRDPDPSSKTVGMVITRRFAHTLTSWPSHNLSRHVECVRCHHPAVSRTASVVPDVPCTACHEDGAALLWCIYFQRDPDPNAITTDQYIHP